MKEKQVFTFLQAMVWVIFIGLCIKAGAIMVSFGVSWWVNPQAAADLYPGVNLMEVYQYGLFHYVAMVWLIISIATMKAYLFYVLIKALGKMDLNSPFEKSLSELLNKMSSISFQVGITAIIIQEYAKWLGKQSLDFSFEGGEKEFLFFAAILYVLSRVFKRGSVLQAENELTI